MDKAQVFDTPEAIDYFRACSLKSGMKLMMAGIKPNRQWTKARAVAAAGQVLGKEYPKRVKLEDVIEDLQFWIKQRQKPAVEAAPITN